MGQKDNHVMEKEQRREAKQHLVVLMHQGISWKEARATVGVHISRSTAYRWVQGVQSRGEAALLDRRHGHPTKLREAVLQWLVATCRANPQMPSREVQAALQEQFDIYVSIGHLNRVRGQLGIENHRGRSKKNSKRSLLPPFPQWQEGAGALLLVAAANTSGLLEALETALSCCAPQAGSRLAHLSSSSRQSLLQTLLFLGVVGLSRPWGLRGYTGDALGRLPGRSRAYGYFHTERFLAELARSNGAEAFTSALARWTTRLWQSEVSAGMNVSALFYIDGHRKPVYTDALIPRGLVGRLSTILGSRTLVLLHDASGHPLLITTHRGDQHLISGLPTVIKQYEQEASLGTVRYLVVDREAMAAEFLAALKETGRTAISVLRTDQYGGLDSFTDIGAFVPLRVSKQGDVLREVAPASIALPLPEQKGQVLQLRVALIRDLCRRVPVPPTKEELDYPRRWDADLDWKERMWWEEGWQATPSPAPPTVPKLIPIVSTAETIDAVELAETYTRRWPLQENIIRDFLLPLGLDTNHGYSKRPVENSEVAKKRTALEKRLVNVQRWAEGARKRSRNGSLLYAKRCKLTKERAKELYHVLNTHLIELEQQGMEDWRVRKTIKEGKAVADAEIEEYQQRQWKAFETSNQEHQKCERYCQEQRQLLCALEDLKAQERAVMLLMLG